MTKRNKCPRQCLPSGKGKQPCRVHGCRVCGDVITAETEDWPAPLCPAHTPDDFLDYVDKLERTFSITKAVVESMVKPIVLKQACECDAARFCKALQKLAGQLDLEESEEGKLQN